MADEKNGKEDEASIDDLDGLASSDSELPAKARFDQMSNIALLMAYDFIDKLRFLQKETLKLPDPEIDARLGHLADTAIRLREVYLDFCDLEF